jgi:hypothetical protein
MNTLTRISVGVATALVALAPLSAAQAAPARASVAKHWTTIETIGKPAGKQQACKVLINRGRDWKIYNRLNDSKVTGGKLEATLTVTQKGVPTKAVWDSGYVHPGHISKVGTVILPRKPGNGLTMAIHGTNFGNGGVVKIGNIGHC